MANIQLNTTLLVEIKNGKRTIKAHIAVVDTSMQKLLNTTTVEVDSEAELDVVYQRLELLYNISQGDL